LLVLCQLEFACCGVGRILALTIAAELAMKRENVVGPGTFLPALIDELGSLRPNVVQEMAKIEAM
jgi:thiamine-phosphate diphosphorylase/hydroxyethylthiazole kinase